MTQGQNDHFDHDKNTIFIIKGSWSKLTDISTILTNFKNKKLWNCGDGHDQISIDHFYHENFGILGYGHSQI
jgi:hypothetical protein